MGLTHESRRETKLSIKRRETHSQKEVKTPRTTHGGPNGFLLLPANFWWIGGKASNTGTQSPLPGSGCFSPLSICPIIGLAVNLMGFLPELIVELHRAADTSLDFVASQRNLTWVCPSRLVPVCVSQALHWSACWSCVLHGRVAYLHSFQQVTSKHCMAGNGRCWDKAVSKMDKNSCPAFLCSVYLCFLYTMAVLSRWIVHCVSIGVSALLLDHKYLKERDASCLFHRGIAPTTQ